MFQFSRGRAGPNGLLLVHAAVFVLPGLARSDTPDRLKARLQEFHTEGTQVTVTMSDSTVIRGQILRISETSFTVRQQSTAQEAVVPFARLKDIRKSGSFRRRKAFLSPAAIVGGAVLVLCMAPYPIGFLCHKDPS
jgi:hypothetical protein